MAFEPEPTSIPTDIGNIIVILKDAVATETDPPQDAYQSGHFKTVIKFSDGSAKQRPGNLIPHITTEERTMLMDFMTSVRSRMVAQILPPS